MTDQPDMRWKNARGILAGAHDHETSEADAAQRLLAAVERLTGERAGEMHVHRTYHVYARMAELIEREVARRQVPPSERIDPFTPLGEGADMITSVHDALKGKEPIIARWMVYLVMAEAIRQRVLQRADPRPSGTERPDYSRGPEQFEEARDGE